MKKNLIMVVQNIRITALECLSLFITLPFYKIYPYQKKSKLTVILSPCLSFDILLVVTNELERALDDPKRAVRKAAVKCRNAWYSSFSYQFTLHLLLTCEHI